MRTLTTRAAVLGDVERRAGLREPEAERALEAALAVLGDRVPEESAECLRSELPAELAAHLDPERRTTVERSVLRSLGAALRPAGVHELRDSLSADYAELWAPERQEEEKGRRVRRPREGGRELAISSSEPSLIAPL